MRKNYFDVKKLTKIAARAFNDPFDTPEILFV